MSGLKQNSTGKGKRNGIKRAGSDRLGKVGVKWEGALDQSGGWEGTLTCSQTNHRVPFETQAHFAEILLDLLDYFEIFELIFSGLSPANANSLRGPV